MSEKGGGSEVETEEEEEEEEEIDTLPIPTTAKNNKPRSSVSAEAFGDWNKKGDFIPPINQKP